MMKKLLWFALILLFVLHQDSWNWNNGRIIAGLPAGLLYHVVYCFAAAILMAALVAYSWPTELKDTES